MLCPFLLYALPLSYICFVLFFYMLCPFLLYALPFLYALVFYALPLSYICFVLFLNGMILGVDEGKAWVVVMSGELCKGKAWLYGDLNWGR